MSRCSPEEIEIRGVCALRPEQEQLPAGKFLFCFLGDTDILLGALCEEPTIPSGSSYGQGAGKELAGRASGGGFVFVVADERGRRCWGEA